MVSTIAIIDEEQRNVISAILRIKKHLRKLHCVAGDLSWEVEALFGAVDRIIGTVTHVGWRNSIQKVKSLNLAVRGIAYDLLDNGDLNTEDRGNLEEIVNVSLSMESYFLLI